MDSLAGLGTRFEIKLRQRDVFQFFFFFSSRRRHTRSDRDWSSDVCSSDLCYCGSGSDILLRVPLGLILARDKVRGVTGGRSSYGAVQLAAQLVVRRLRRHPIDRKSTRLNSSHDQISYAVFCLKKKKSRLCLCVYECKTKSRKKMRKVERMVVDSE